MVKGKLRRDPIDKDDVLSLVDDYSIYRFYLGEFIPGQAFCNPLREESDPSMIVSSKGGFWHHKDFGNYYYRGNCLQLVQQVYHCDFPTALKYIDRDFRLGLGKGKIVEKSPVITWESKGLEPIGPPLIQVVTRKFTREELRYWNEYYQGIDDLKREDIFAPKEIIRNKRRIPFKTSLLTYGYFYRDVQKWKIYRPHGSTSRKAPLNERKWDGNLPFTYIENLEGVHDCDIAFGEKSKKDRMVLMKALETSCVYNTQAEDPACFSDEDLTKIKENSRIQVCVSDSDDKGKEFSWWLTNNHGYKHCNPPDVYRKEGIKDFADMARVYGLNSVTQHFIQKGFL